jgi:hypothetical protein|tara:strand:+ start:1475 stop:1771 length:297 start_codon:yes stop_codon:yes gene_type:complete
MKKRSRWVETEVEEGGKVYLLPVRCRIEAKDGYVRTTVQSRDCSTGKWSTKIHSVPIHMPGTSRISLDQLEEMAQQCADILIKSTHDSLHPDWEVSDE